jgi:hypothetical protein
MSIEKFTIEMMYDTEDPDWIGFDFDGLNGMSGNDPIEEFINSTFPNALRECLEEAITFRGE